MLYKKGQRVKTLTIEEAQELCGEERQHGYAYGYAFEGCHFTLPSEICAQEFTIESVDDNHYDLFEDNAALEDWMIKEVVE